MAYTLAARSAANTAVLSLISTGSGAAALQLYAGAMLVATLELNHAASLVSPVTGELILIPVTGITTAAASGTVTHGRLVGRDGTVIDDSIPAQVGSAAVMGYVTMPSLVLAAGGAVELISLTLG